MFELISKLQRKDERQRQAIAFWSAVSVTAVIALGWLVSVVTLHAPSAANTAASSDASLPGTDQLQNIGSSAADFYQQFKSNFNQIRAGISGTSEQQDGSAASADASSQVDVQSSAQSQSNDIPPASPTWSTQ